MNPHRWREFDGTFAPNAHDEALEIDVTWAEFERLLPGTGASFISVAAVVENCRRIFDADTLRLIESYVAERGDLPMFNPSKAVAARRRAPPLRAI